MIHENAQHATSLKELAGKRVSVVYRHYWHNYLESRYPDIILDPVSNPLQGLFRVMSGHSDALVDYKASVLPKLEDNTHLRLQATSTIPAQSGLSIGRSHRNCEPARTPFCRARYSRAMNQGSSYAP